MDSAWRSADLACLERRPSCHQNASRILAHAGRCGGRGLIVRSVVVGSASIARVVRARGRVSLRGSSTDSTLDPRICSR